MLNGNLESLSFDWLDTFESCDKITANLKKLVKWPKSSTQNKAAAEGERIRQPDLVAFVGQLSGSCTATNASLWIPSSSRTNLRCFWLVPNINARPFISSYPRLHYIQDNSVYSLMEAVDTKMIRIVLQRGTLCHSSHALKKSNRDNAWSVNDWKIAVW